MKLCKTHAVSVFDNQRVDIRHINSRFDYRCANENIYFAFKKPSPDLAQLVLAHLSVADADIRFGQKRLYFGGFSFDILNSVI